ncbi:DUF3846 domain-containing protein [Streptomyces sp. NPDC046909]|uniref:DUF3846 domain-containing protein n=1 Tax=Streptomyces sp. NPDC046909 TaxID=3155617 RepID=UPI0033C6FCC4
MSETTTTAPGSVNSFGLLIQPTGTFRLLTWQPVNTPHHALCCDLARPVDLTTALTMWVDQDAAAHGAQPNRAITGLLGLYQPTPQTYCGDVVFTGTPDAQGGADGMTRDQAIALLTLYSELGAPSLLPRPRR